VGSEGASYRRGPRPTRRCCEFKLSATIGVEDSGGQSPLAKSKCVLKVDAKFELRHESRVPMRTATKSQRGRRLR
jgi:hypothetical protein